MNAHNTINTVLLALIAVALAFAILMPKDSGEDATFGASESTTVTNPYTFEEDVTFSTANITSTGGNTAFGTTTVENLVTGGQSCTLTDANGGKTILTSTLLKKCGRFEFAAGGAGQAVIQLEPQPTSTLATAGFIPNAGDCKYFDYSTDYLAAGTTTTHTATTGVNVIAYTTADDVLDGNEFSQWRMCRTGIGDIDWFVTEILHAD